jgi:hypothetical protein
MKHFNTYMFSCVTVQGYYKYFLYRNRSWL